MNGVCYLALSIGLLTETSFAFGQTPSPTCRTGDGLRAPIWCSDNVAPSSSRRAAIGRFGDSRAPRRHRSPIQDGPKVANYQNGRQDAPPCGALAVRQPARGDYADIDRRTKRSGHTFSR
jgi:hypothetical protein